MNVSIKHSGRAVLLAVAWIAPAVAAPGTVSPPAEAPAVIASRLQDRASMSNDAYALVSELTTRFGPRPAGSASELAAAQWGVQRLRAMGFENVALESFPLQRWMPGATHVQVVGSSLQHLVATPLGGSPPAVGIDAEAVVFSTYAQFLQSTTTTLAGRIAVVVEPLKRTADGSGYATLVEMRSKGPHEAAQRGAIAFVMRSLATHLDRFANSGATQIADNIVPSFAISPPDAEQLVRLAASGKLHLRLDSTAETSAGCSQNVVAEIVGREPHDDPVLIGAHLDSWEQGTGATDDGFGIAVVTAASKLIADLPMRPRRTIRVVWFGAEEVSQPPPVNDFAGARAYLARHAAELPMYTIAGESDWGAGRIVSLSPPPGPGGIRLARESEPVLARLGIRIMPLRVKGGPDIAILQQAGVPAFRLNQDASGLFDVHHGPNDVLERIDTRDLNQNVAAWAALLWLLADSDGGFRVGE
jgi:carboxypeptidase Q